jgi:Zn-dependent peptidase ImmA (M78 family)/transcriptional regulator with XRE-family HTH domain
MDRIFNPGLLQVARQARSFSQELLAEKAKLTQGYLSKLEHGLIQPNSEAISALSSSLAFPQSFFFEPDQVVGLPVSVHPMFRKRASVGKRALDALQAQLNIRLFQLRRLLPAVNLQRQLELPYLDIDEHGGDVERVAELVRRQWLVPSGPMLNLTALLERAGCLVIHCDLSDLLVDGITVRTADLPPCIFVKDSLPGDRLRFTLAHELGHLVMHRVPNPEMEDQANEFAAALLMPRRDFTDTARGLGTSLAALAQLKPVWKVAMQACLIRMQTVGLMAPGQAGYLWRRISALGYRTREPAELDIAVEQPSVLPKIVDLHLNKLGYTLSDLSRALHMFDDEFAGLYRSNDASRRGHLRLVK